MSNNEESNLDVIKAKAYLIDITSAFAAAICLTPFVSIVDRAVVEKSADKSKNVFKLAFNNILRIKNVPKQFFTEPIFFAVFGVYFSTYVAANCIQSWCSFAFKDSKIYKLLGTTLVNMPLGVLKDRYIARTYNGQQPSRFPGASWSLFLVRDLCTIGSGFTAPPLLTNYINNYINKNNINNKNTDNKWVTNVSQMLVPIVFQLVLTPIHLLALDFYNNKISSFNSRVKSVAAGYVESTVIRWGRVIAAYGVAGIINTDFRNMLRCELLPAQYHANK